MDPHQNRRCKWEGCRSYDLVPESVYCQEHRRQKQYHSGRPSPSDKTQVFSAPSSNSPLGHPRDSISSRLVTGVAENGSISNLPSTGKPSSPNEKKQLPDRHTARKSIKPPSNLGQPHLAPLASPVRRPSIDPPAANPRPVKRQRTSGMTNGSESYPRSNSSSFSENGIPHLPNRDDFALRPKKKETANEPARPKLFNDQRQFYRGESHPSHSSRPTPTSTKPQSISFNGNARPGSSLVIDLTKDDPSRPPLTRPKPQLPPQNHAPDGITIVNQKVQRSADENPAMPLERKGFVAVNDRQLCDDPPLSQPGGISQARHGPSVEQARDSQTPKLPRDVILNTPTMQPTPKPTKETFPEAPTNRRKPNGAALSNGSESVHMNFSDTSIHQRDLPAIRGHQASNEIRQTPPSEKHSGPTNPDSGASNTQHTMAKKPPKSTVQAKSIPNAPVTPQLGTTVIAPPQRTVTPQGPLSALLGGREWKKMSPEERRLFWVSQHNTENFDSQIYSEHNRPFRPGDALFGVTDDAFAPRPNQPAKHFDYIDPRIHYANQPSQEHYQQQQKQISARGNRKTHFGQAIKRAAQKKRASLKPDQTRKQAILPRRVQENPKWLAALGVLEKLEAQKRDKDRAKLGQGKANDKAKETTTATIDVDCDVVMESS